MRTRAAASRRMWRPHRCSTRRATCCTACCIRTALGTCCASTAARVAAQPSAVRTAFRHRSPSQHMLHGVLHLGGLGHLLCVCRRKVDLFKNQ